MSAPTPTATGPSYVEAVRCDRCGARAIAVSEHTAAELGWCGHHLREHADGLAAVGATWRRIDLAA